MVLNFRAWDEIDKFIKSVHSINFHDKVVILQDRVGCRVQRLFTDVELMQSTGLKDKNGVEIFEGDILTDEGSFGFDFWDYGEVVFDKDEYTYLIEWKSENVCESITNCGDYSIASNIYENKELVRYK